MLTFRISGMRIRVIDGILYIAAEGESIQDSTRAALDMIAHLMRVLTTAGIPFKTYERKRGADAYETDTIILRAP